eukprot:TRINITY_DN7706_c0_g1_i1.p2 TRINITY_DN7706_c0_g1~~TRINITY_DN7706_c0_g1_i1.p2  ORF type:complete len:150 (+),score=69.49 TRINITY_DN7706_c0_g1_i1:1-450(+)
MEVEVLSLHLAMKTNTKKTKKLGNEKDALKEMCRDYAREAVKEKQEGEATKAKLKVTEKALFELQANHIKEQEMHAKQVEWLDTKLGDALMRQEALAKEVKMLQRQLKQKEEVMIRFQMVMKEWGGQKQKNRDKKGENGTDDDGGEEGR